MINQQIINHCFYFEADKLEMLAGESLELMVVRIK